MRAPIYIVIISCLLAAIIPWWIGTHGKDFMTPPSSEEIAAVSTRWQATQPVPKSASEYLSAPTDQSVTLETKLGTEKKPSLQEMMPTMLNHAPQLSEYSELASHGSAALIKLAEHLQENNHATESLLAWERVIDRTRASKAQKNKAIRAINRQQTALSPWNTDTENDISIILHAGANPKVSQVIKGALSEVAEIINRDSGHILKVTTKKSTGNISAQAAGVTSVSLWFSRPSGQSVETQPVSIAIDLKDPASFKQQMKRGIYQILLVSLPNRAVLPELSSIKQKEDPFERVTRLMWQDLSGLLK